MLCADVDGFSLHAAVHRTADDRQALEQLCRYAPAACETGCTHHRPVWLGWAKLLKRVSRSTWSTARTAVAGN